MEKQIGKVDVFHSIYLDEAVDRAFEKCPDGWEVVDLDVKYLNDQWVVIAKINRLERSA